MSLREMSLTERRAEFVYNAARLAAIGSNAPIVPVTWEEREQPFKDQLHNYTNLQNIQDRGKDFSGDGQDQH